MKILTEDEVRCLIKLNDNKSYTYGLCRNNGELYYVGVGIKNRVTLHISDYELINGSNKLKNNITKKENDLGGVKFVIFLVHHDRQECLNLERKLIVKFGRIIDGGLLSNLTFGGEIGPTGVLVSEDTREKLRNCGIKNREVLSKKSKSWWDSLSEEDKNYRVNKMLSNTNNDTAKIAIAEATKSRWKDEDYRAKLKNKYKDFQSKPEQRERNSNTMKAKWEDPEYRKYMLERRKIARTKKLTDKVDNV